VLTFPGMSASAESCQPLLKRDWKGSGAPSRAGFGLKMC